MDSIIKEKLKKSIAAFMAVVLIFCLCACGSKDDPGKPNPNTEPVNNDPVQQDDPVQPDPVSDGEKGTFYPVPIMYHLIMEEPYSQYTGLFVRPADFEEQLKTLQEAGYGFLFADEYSPNNPPSVVITFDDGYEDNYTTMFPILQKYNAKATIFLIGDYIDDPGHLTEDQIREMAESGLVHFGCHTSTHCKLSDVSAEKARDEFSRCVEKVETLTGRECRSLAYPYGAFNETIKKVAEEFFDYCYTTVGKPKTWPNYYELPRVNADREIKAPKMLELVRKMYKELNK